MPKIPLKKIGEKIKILRKQNNISQEQLAKAMGIPRPSISQLENGRRDLTLAEIKTLLQIFKITFEEFIKYGDEHPPKKTPSKSINKKIHFYSEKFKNLLLYILEKCGSKPNVGETVLYKLLYFCDFDYFEIFEKPLSGMKYKKMQYGPVPEQNLYNPIISEMVKQGFLKIINLNLGQGMFQRKYINLKSPNLELFNVRELELADKVINRLSDMSARQIENHVHEDYPWESHKHDEEIEYGRVFMREGEFAQRDYEADFINAGLHDANENLEPLTKKEYEYYMSLPDKNDKQSKTK